MEGSFTRVCLLEENNLEPAEIKLKKEDAHPTATASAGSHVYGASSTADIITQPAEESSSQLQAPSRITDREIPVNVMSFILLGLPLSSIRECFRAPLS